MNTEMRALTAKELDLVAGGFFNVAIGTQIATPVAVALAGAALINVASANVLQAQAVTAL